MGRQIKGLGQEEGENETRKTLDLLQKETRDRFKKRAREKHIERVSAWIFNAKRKKGEKNMWLKKSEKNLCPLSLFEE